MFMAERKPRIYVASPYGFDEARKPFYYDKFIPAIREAIDCAILDPWEWGSRIIHENFVAEDDVRGLRKRNMAIARRNLKGLNEADGIVAVLDGVDVDSGVAFEIGFAHAQKKPVVEYRGDFRPSGENAGCTVNLMVEYPTLVRGDRVARNLNELIEQMKEVFGK